MPGTATKLGPFTGGLHNSSGSGEFIANEELFELTNLEVDLDGSLANRPEIHQFVITGMNTYGCSFIGTYIPSDDRKFLVVYSPGEDKVYLVDANTGIAGTSTPQGVTAVCSVQYANKLWVVAKPGALANGGYFDAPTSTTTTWTTVATMPKGEAITLYRERAWIACGISATTNTSRFYFSAVADLTSWTGSDFIDVFPGNGQKLSSLIRVGQDIVLFKQNSTYKFTYTTDPRKAELNVIDDTIGIPNYSCVAIYNNNTIYVLYNSTVYELYQYTYNRISDLIDMTQVSDLDLFGKDQYGVTIHRDRLFVRHFVNLYVYSLRVKKWSKWISTRKFSEIVVIPSATVGLDTAFVASASLSYPYETYWFQDNRLTYDAGLSETIVPFIPGTSHVEASPGTNVVIPAPIGVVIGQWVYVCFMQSWSGSVEAAPTVPTGFIPVVTRQVAGTAGAGIEWWIWRKKRVAGDTTYTITSPSSHTMRAVAVAVSSTDTPPDVGSIVGQRSSVSPSVTVFNASTIERPDQSIGLTFMVNRNTSYMLPVPPTVTNGMFDTSSPTAADLLQVFAVHQVLDDPDGGTLKPTTLSFTQPDIGQVGGVQLTIPVVSQSTTPAIERFQAEITTKTYDYDVPQSYKVHFWWGVLVATSGRFNTRLVVPNSKKNLTYEEARNLYVTWATAQASGITWSNRMDVMIPDEVFPTLGQYARKFIKLMKKCRYRQAYFNLIFDVITNNGIADASLRVYDLTVLIKQKETVVKQTS